LKLSSAKIGNQRAICERGGFICSKFNKRYKRYIPNRKSEMNEAEVGTEDAG